MLSQKISEVSGIFGEEFLEINNIWENYKNQRVNVLKEKWEGGSGQGIAMLQEEIYLTEHRISEIKNDIKNGLYTVYES